MRKYYTYAATDVASALLHAAGEKGLYLTNLQLQKLAYISHAISLSKLERPLFIEDVRAWQHGPVIPSIYIKYKEYRSLPIDCKVEEVGLDTESSRIISSVIEKFGELDPWHLVNLTHREGSPWSRTWTKEKYSIIPDKIIKEHYDHIYAQGFAASL